MLMLLSFLLAFGPWGKGAEIAFLQPPVRSQRAPLSHGQLVAKKLIQFHQEVISPADGPRSHFFPSSSSYTAQAIEIHGVLKGFLLGCDRLMRENDDPWLYPSCIGAEGTRLKYDPVPRL